MKSLLIVDVEATCWENNRVPPGEQSEIIEIGVCRLDIETQAISDARGILIQPARSKVSAFCTQLTSITPEMVAQGVSFAEACALLETDYAAKGQVWASWGNYDRRMFETQCASFGVAYPFSDQHLNLKDLHARVTGLHRQVGMAAALRAAGLELHGTHHRGGDDALNIARIIGILIARHGAQILTV